MICSTRRFLGRLGTDATGNTLALVAAALLPITAMIGSGLDMSRAYMAKSRLQSACDAASLAARREMKNDVLSTEVIDTGKKFFNFNFAQGSFQTQAFEPQISKPEVGVVRIEASTRIPTTIMQLFGFSTLPLNVSCDASLNFVNTDVVLVLDVTGSMDETVGGTKKIVALREAVMALYDELAPVQAQLKSQNLRLRYGIVPYSSTVNVGRLIAEENENYITSSTTYQTYTFNYNTWSGGRFRHSNSGQYTQSSFDTSVFKRPNGTISLVRNQDGTVGVSKAYNLQELASAGTDFRNPENIRWNGCIEERETNRTAINGGTSYTIPADAFDLDINRIPDSDRTRWRPMLPDAIYDSSGWSWTEGRNTVRSNRLRDVPAHLGYSACPSEARRLQEWTRTELDDYVDGLVPVGGTYHDIGMIWGARFISTGGIFADSCEEYNGMPCNRHVIFMTDGAQTAYCNVYTAYGVEQRDRRVLSSACNANALLARHEQRFRMICNATKNMNVSVWVIAFDTALNPNLIGCASNPSQASTSNNRDELLARFREIGNQIGALRLTK